MVSRGVRNNNPGNIRKGVSRFRGEIFPSQDLEFKQFESAAWGYRAIFLLVKNYDTLYGINTLDGIIRRWAPPCENNTRRYIDVVAQRLNVKSSAYIDWSDREVMIPLAWSISKVENGVTPTLSEIEQGWELFSE
ncbi:MAG: structural protein P5 [Rikenellaceae bacterium]